jgi:hypothetical protein
MPPRDCIDPSSQRDRRVMCTPAGRFQSLDTPIIALDGCPPEGEGALSQEARWLVFAFGGKRSTTGGE